MSMQILLDEKQRRFYSEALENFESERSIHLVEVERLNGLIESIKKTLGVAGGNGTVMPPTAMNSPTGPYSAMGMRDAIIALLREHPEGLRVGEVAKALVAGGLQSGAKDVTQSIAAALSIMRSKQGKLDNSGGRYFIPAQQEVNPSSET